MQILADHCQIYENCDWLYVKHEKYLGDMKVQVRRATLGDSLFVLAEEMILEFSTNCLTI